MQGGGLPPATRLPNRLRVLRSDNSDVLPADYGTVTAGNSTQPDSSIRHGCEIAFDERGGLVGGPSTMAKEGKEVLARSATTIAAVAIAIGTGPVLGGEQDRYLVGSQLTNAFAGVTLIGANWAEYYAPDGRIVGRVKYMGLLHEFTGRWTVKHDQVCFEYALAQQYNTCSKFHLSGDRMRHFGADDQPKPDGVSRRLDGNRLDEFR